MEKVTKGNIEHVVNSLATYYNRIATSGQFNLQELVSFMEPKFAEAGYRNRNDISGGGCYSQTDILILTEPLAGDFILTTGAIREVRRIYPDAHIVLLAYPNTFSLAECCPHVDEIIIDNAGASTAGSNDIANVYASELPVCRQLLSYKFDIAFRFGFHLGSSLLLYLCGAKIRITARDNALAALATHPFWFHEYERNWHTVEKMLMPLDHMLNIPLSNRKIELWYTAADMTFAKSLLDKANSRLYALNMGGTGLVRHYPPEKYAKLIEMILGEESDASFVIIGGGELDAQSAEILKSTLAEIYADNIIDLTNKTTYRQSAAVLSFCDMYIGNITGSIHAAAAVGCAALGVNCFANDLFSRIIDDPKIWYPYGVPNVIVQPAHALPECAVNEPYKNIGCRQDFPHCITQIEPETIYRGFKLLKQRVEQHNTEPLYIH